MIGTQSGALYATGSTYTPQFGTLPVAQGGTNKTYFTPNAIIVGNGTELVEILSNKKGVLKSSGNSHQIPAYGFVDVTDGGTGKQSFTSNSVVIGDTSTALGEVTSSQGAFYSTGNNETPKFGILPINSGGTGADNVADARINIGATHTLIDENPSIENDFILKIENVATPIEGEEEG